jgi:hypothetical protein
MADDDDCKLPCVDHGPLNEGAVGKIGVIRRELGNQNSGIFLINNFQ